MQERLWTVAEVAAYLRLHPQTVREKLRSGAIAGAKVGDNWRIPESAMPTIWRIAKQDSWTVEDAAGILRVAPSTIRRWLRDGSLPGHKKGREWRIERKDTLLRIASQHA
jgi:excisionase family DNA binding protein